MAILVLPDHFQILSAFSRALFFKREGVYSPPYKPGKKSAPPYFSKRRTFSTIGLRGTNSIFEKFDIRKMLSSSRKRGAADAFENNP
jgi:hypothetical protein